MADERLIFPIGFDLEEGVEQVEKDWGVAQRRLQKTIDGKPLTIKVDSKGLEQFKTYSDNMRNSINKIREAMKELDKTWNSMSDFEKFDEGGDLTSGAQELVQKYNELTVALQTYGKTLGQIASDAKRAAEEEVKAQQREIDAYEDYWKRKEAENAKQAQADIDDAARKRKAQKDREEQERKSDAKRYQDWLKTKNQETVETEKIERQKQQSIERTIEKQNEAFEKARLAQYELNKASYDTQVQSNQQAILNQQKNREDYEKMVAEYRELQNQQERLTMQGIEAEQERIRLKQQAQQASDEEYENLVRQIKAEQRLAASKVIQPLRQKVAMLQAQENTIDAINRKLRIQQERLRSADMGSAKFQKIAAEIKRLTEELDKANARVAQLTGRATQGANQHTRAVQATNAAYKTQSGYISRLIQRMGVYFGIHQAFNFIRNIREVTAEFELQRVALGSIIGDMNEANKMFEQIKAAAVKSPFQIKELVSYTKQLAAYKIEQDELFETTQRLADVSAGLGVGMERLVLAYGQIRATGYLRASEVRQLTEAGIPIVEELAKKMSQLRGETVSAADVMQLISERAISFGMVKEVFDDMTSAGGMFYKMQEKQAETLAGQWLNLKDSVAIMYDEIGNTRAVNGAMKGMIEKLKRLMTHWDAIASVMKTAGYAWVTYAATMKVVLPLWRGLVMLIKHTTMALKIVGNALKAFGKTLLISLPIAALTAVVTLIDEWITASKNQKKAIEEVNKAVEQRTLELDRIEVAYRAVQKAAAKANKEDEAFARQSYGEKIEQLQKIAEMLKQYNLGNAIDFSVLTPDNIDEVFDAWTTKLREVNSLSQTFGVKLAEVANANESTILGWSLAGENLKEDMQDLSESWADMVTNSKFRSELDRMRVYVDEMAATNEDFYKVLSDAVGEDAKIALSQKRRNESEYDYYMRIQDAYKKIRSAAMGGTSTVDALNQALDGTFRAFHALDTSEFESDMREVMHEFNKIKHTFENEDPLAIRMAIDEQFTINGWNDWQKDLVIRELNKERLKVGLELIPTVSSSKEGSVKTGIQSILNTEFNGLFSKDELEKIIDPESAIKAIEARMKGAVETIETLNKAAINSVSEANKGALEEIGRLQSEINDELKKDEKDRNDNLIKTNRMQIASIAAQNEAYEKQIQLEKEKAEADYNLAKSAQDMLLSQGLTDVAEDVKNTFGDLIVNELDAIKGNISEKFLISAKDLVGIKDIGDLYDLWAKQTKAITEEKTKLAEVGMDEATITAEQNRLETERAEKQAELARVEAEIADLGYDTLQQQYEQLNVSLASATTDKERKQIQADIDALLADENYSKGASLSLTRSLLLAEIARGNAALEANQNTIDFLNSLPNLEKLWEDLGKRWNFKLQDKGKKGGSGEDPWIILIKNRMSYMQDFQKGVENLSKFMANEAALQQEQLIMLNRGLSLNIDAKKLTGSREELLKWYDDAIKAVTDKIKNMGGNTWSGLGVEAILGKDTKNRVIKAYQQLLQELFNQKTDFQTKKLQEDMEKELKRLSDQISRTKTAKEFFDRMLGLTGDRELTATLTMSVYGTTGDDLKEAMVKQVMEAFKGVDISDAVSGLTIDYNKLETYIKDLPEEQQKTAKSIVENWRKTNQDIISDIYKTYEDFLTYEERKTRVVEEENAERMRIINSGLPMEEQEKLIEASKKRENKALGDIAIEEFMASEDWAKSFEDLEHLSTPTIERLMAELKGFIDTQKDLTPEQLRTLTNEYKKLYKGLIARNPFKAMTDGIKEYVAATKDVKIAKDRVETAQEELRIATERKAAAEQNFKTSQDVVTAGREYASAIKEYNKASQNAADADRDLEDAIDAQKTALNKTVQGFNAASSAISNFGSIITDITDILGIAEDSEAGAFIQDLVKWLGLMAGVLGTVSAIIAIIEAELAPLLAIAAGIAAIGAAISFFSNAKVRRANKEIERQQELLDNLAYSYERLEKAQEKAFGSDYISNYEQRMANLEAQQAAYLAQAEAERSKGKKADADKIKEYEEKARDTADEIKDMQSELQEYFLGTDLTSAARDFANAWIDAYKEFGNTTDAMKEKFQDMIQNMIVESFAAKVIQTALEPIFDSIDKMSKDGVLDMSEAAEIARMTDTAVGNIDVGMTNLMNALSQAGISVRGMGSDLTGISKDIATASEENILGLAAGINTQNFYISQVPPKLDVIIGLLQGGNLTQGSAITLQDLVTIQNQHLSYLPSIAQHTADTVAECKQIVAETRRTADALERVIKPRGTQATHTLNATLN